MLNTDEHFRRIGKRNWVGGQRIGKLGKQTASFEEKSQKDKRVKSPGKPGTYDVENKIKKEKNYCEKHVEASRCLSSDQEKRKKR